MREKKGVSTSRKIILQSTPDILSEHWLIMIGLERLKNITISFERGHLFARKKKLKNNPKNPKIVIQNTLFFFKTTALLSPTQ